MDKQQASPHSHALQALRGLAAALVLVHHALRVFDDGGPAFWFSEVVLNAHAAVVLFFVLSGYVLTKSLVSRGLAAPETTAFWVRRAFRIYPALWCGLALAAAYVIVFQPLDSQHFSAWANGSMTQASLSPFSVVLAMAGLGSGLLPPSWTITVELAGSVALPFMALAMKGRWRVSVLIVILLAALSLWFGSGAKQIPLYLVHFALGAVLATSDLVRRIPVRGLAMLLAAVVLLYFRQLQPWDYHDPLPSLVEGLASTVLIAGLISNHPRWLTARPLVLLGDWSYSLYLIHVPVAFALAKLIDSRIDISGAVTAWSFALAASTFAITLLLSWALFERVEKPGIRLGQIFLAGPGQRFFSLAAKTPPAA